MFLVLEVPTKEDPAPAPYQKPGFAGFITWYENRHSHVARSLAVLHASRMPKFPNYYLFERSNPARYRLEASDWPRLYSGLL
jgi:hypothetical protein